MSLFPPLICHLLLSRPGSGSGIPCQAEAGDSNDRAALLIDQDQISDQFQEIDRRRAAARGALAIGEEGRAAINVFGLIVPNRFPERDRSADLAVSVGDV